jgi:hypothetical protein
MFYNIPLAVGLGGNEQTDGGSDIQVNAHG